MDEFPGFTFSQSSSCLYAAVEQNYPALFEEIPAQGPAGAVGDRGGPGLRGDTNDLAGVPPGTLPLRSAIFPRAVRQDGGRGLGADTFGHTAQMRQILRQGCRYYYFCRGGKGKPLF